MLCGGGLESREIEGGVGVTKYSFFIGVIHWATWKAVACLRKYLEKTYMLPEIMCKKGVLSL